MSFFCKLQVIRMAKLIHETLRAFGFLHDALLIILSNRSREFVIVHGRSVFSLAPQSSDSHRIFNLENSFCSIKPSDRCAIGLRIGEKFLQELPQVNMCWLCAFLLHVSRVFFRFGFCVCSWLGCFFLLIFDCDTVNIDFHFHFTVLVCNN